MKLFTYGSLKAGQYNHELLNGCKQVGAFCTEPHYQMLNLGAFPGIVWDLGNGIGIWGEVYEIDEGILTVLDRIEGHPDFYRREEIMTPWGNAWVYMLRPERGEHAKCTVASGDWK